VPHDHVGGLAPGRDDGDDALRPPGYRGFHRRQGRPARLRMFNVSVLATDAFMEAVKADGPWELTFGGQVYKTFRRAICGTGSCARPTTMPSRA
jgi:hypothetical protein